MNERSVCLFLLACMASVLLDGAAVAGDEDISPSAYQVFDPETGFMIPADQLPAAQQGHAVAGGHAASDVMQGNEPGKSSARPNYLLASTGLAIAGIVAWLLRSRYRRRPASGD